MRALVLSGGGAKAAFQVGVLRQLADLDIDYDIVAGSSAGALNAAVVATDDLYYSVKKLERIWLEEIEGNSSIWKHNFLYYMIAFLGGTSVTSCLAFVSAFFGWHIGLTTFFCALVLASFIYPYFVMKRVRSIYKTWPLERLVRKHIGTSFKKKIFIEAVCYETGERKVIDESYEDFADWVLASGSFPMFFPPKQIDGNHWVDGGLIDMVPLQEVIKKGATEIDIILCFPKTIDRSENLGLLAQLERLLDIMSFEIVRNDIFKTKNVKINIYAPKEDKYSFLDFNKNHIKELYEKGLVAQPQVL